MELEVLCIVNLPNDEAKLLDEAAKHYGLTRQEVIRSAVKDWSRLCVPRKRRVVRVEYLENPQVQ